MSHCILIAQNSKELFYNLTKLLSSTCSCEELAAGNENLIFKCNFHPIPFSVQFIFFCLFGFVAILSISANSIVIWIILRHPVMRQRATNMQILNLAISDICLTLFNTIPIGIVNVHEKWVFPASLCPFVQMVGIIPFSVSVFTMVLISLDRYYAIIYPFHRRPWGDSQSHRITFIALAIIWLLAFFLALPEFFIMAAFPNVNLIGRNNEGRQKLYDIGTFCQAQSEDILKIYNWAMLFLQFMLPIFILLYTYYWIALELYNPKNDPMENCRSQQNSILNAKRRTAKLFALLVFTFLSLWLPYQVIFTLPNEKLMRIWPIGFKIIFHLIFLLAMSSTIVSSIIYFNISERFRTGFCYALRFVPFWRGGGITTAQYRDVFALNGCPRLSRVLFAAGDFPENQKE